MKQLLIKLKISTRTSIVPYFPKVRDRGDISVLKCQKSGVILLSRSDHMDIAHYRAKEKFSWGGAKNRASALLEKSEDARRRAEQFGPMVTNKRWLDIGTGAGGILDLLSPAALETVTVEPQEVMRQSLLDAGHNAYPTVEEVKEKDFDVVTMFHVLEHLAHPIKTLKSIRGKMAKSGKIIVEVPHANDVLISFFENEAFKSFTFWSEHLILHTRESLRAFLEAAGFSNIVIAGFQRYPLANHLHWLSRGKPGGHVAWPYLRTAELDQAYANMLSGIDKTDTLIAVAEQ